MFSRVVLALCVLTFGFAPLVTLFFDMYWWIFTGHGVSGIEWHGFRLYVVLCWTVFVGSVTAIVTKAIAEV